MPEYYHAPESQKHLDGPTGVGSRCNPELMAMKQRLQEKGKPPKVILIACARKLLTILNAMVRDQTEWKTMPA